MGMKRALTALFAVLSWSSAASAQAEKISAINTDRGRMVFRNDASFVGIGVGAPTTEFGFASGTLQRAHFDPQFAIAPSIDIFIIPNLSLGGSIGFTFNKFNTGFGTADLFTFFFMPRVGYNIPIANRFSLWPQVGIGVGVSNVSFGGGSDTEAMIPMDVFVPFLFHPAENFFLGMGPAMRFYSLHDKAAPTIVTIDILRFTLAGSVPVF
jgi:hypothetical protein